MNRDDSSHHRPALTVRDATGVAPLLQRLDAAESLARVGTYELYGEKFVICSPQFLTIHGYPPQGMPPSLADLLSRIDRSG